jgi:hypothetical protein
MAVESANYPILDIIDRTGRIDYFRHLSAGGPEEDVLGNLETSTALARQE